MGFDLSTAQPVEEQKKPGFDLSSATPQRSPEEQAAVDRAKWAGAIGVGAAAGTWGGGRLLRWAFPFTAPKRAFLKELDSALKKDFGEGLKDMYPRYTSMVRDTGKPVTFADWVASQTARAPETMSLLNKSVDRGGAPNKLVEGLEQRGAGQKGRVLSDLASALGIPEKSLSQTEEEFAKMKASNAKTLYGEAFRNKQPLLDQKVYDLFEKHGPIMEGALDNAREAFKYDPSKQVDEQTISALAGHRKDRWKYLVDAKNVPESLYIGEPRNQLQRVITPNIETLDRMKRALWNLQQKRVKEGAGDVGRIAQARKELTSLLDQIGPKEYQEARKQYAGDVALEEAADIGSNIFKQDPNDLRMKLLGMSPDERTALARGFYGSLSQMNDPKFIREIVSGNPAYAKQRDLLSAVFPDTNQLHDFMRSLQGEEAMRAGQKAFSGPGSPEPAGRGPHIGAYISGVGRPHGWLSEVMPPYDPMNTTMKRGQPMVFGKPDFSAGTTIPGGEPIANLNRGWPHGSGFWWEAGAPTVAGGLGAASPYLKPYVSDE